MPVFRVCKSFTVESGHMLSKHPERCRFPHGHTRQIEIVVSSDRLNEFDMVVDFKALRLALSDYIERFDHSMAINSKDPTLKAIRSVHPESLVVFEGVDPTTEVLAKDIYDFASRILKDGFRSGPYVIEPSQAHLDRVRVWETPSSWAEYGD